MENLEQFTARMSEVEYKKQYVIGRAYQGDTRSVYEFEKQTCFLESRGYRTLGNLNRPATPAQMYYVASADPSNYWVHARLIYGKGRSEKIAEYYHATGIEEEPYAKESGVWFSLVFKEFDDLIRMVYDIHIGKWNELWGKEKKEYLSCIGD